MQHLDALATQTANTGSIDFGWLARCLAGGRGEFMSAKALAEGLKAPQRVQGILRQAVSDGHLAQGWAAPLGDLGALVGGFLASLRQVGLFDRVLSSTQTMPGPEFRIIVSTSAVTGSVVPEGSMKPVNQLALAADTLPPRKAVAITVVTAEVARLAGPIGTDIFRRELTGGVAAATDTELIAILTDGLAGTPSAGADPQDVLADIRAALRAMDTDAASALFLACGADVAKVWATMATAGGDAAFPLMTPKGGAIAGLPVIVTAALTDSFVTLDAHQLATASGGVILDASEQADVQLADVPDSPPGSATVMTSLWQRGLTAVRAERNFAVARLRDGAAAIITGLSYT